MADSILKALLFSVLFLFTSVLSADVYRWTDASGRTVFGDSPPEQSKALPVELPTLTVADSYSDGKQENKPAASAEAKDEEDAENETVEYKQFAVTSPEKDSVVRANNGNIMVRLALEPALQKGHGIVVYLDGKQVASGDSSVFSLESVDRGKHSVFAVLHDENDDVLKNTEAVSFNLLRHSVLK
uniref:DUF4124 domain-containing protein n=1 Tax=uncultured Thiotrichaceae bacterium TaxID=298394 RepID=A0A6S6UNH2_9GAMM|nr:MAG: Unknown protein [uncultured Thiotrichaceae bacterium]